VPFPGPFEQGSGITASQSGFLRQFRSHIRPFAARKMGIFQQAAGCSLSY
jgi:hypothetical protein